MGLAQHNPYTHQTTPEGKPLLAELRAGDKLRVFGQQWLPCALTPPTAAHGAKPTRKLGGHSLFSSQARHLRFPLLPFSYLQAEKVPVNKREVLCYSTRVCYNSTQWSSCCLPTWMQPFSKQSQFPVQGTSECPEPHPMTRKSSSVCYAYNQNKSPCFIYNTFI